MTRRQRSRSPERRLRNGEDHKPPITTPDRLLAIAPRTGSADEADQLPIRSSVAGASSDDRMVGKPPADTAKPALGHKVYPYLLRKLAVTRPNRVWATDIFHIPTARGCVHLVAIVDRFTRGVLARLAGCRVLHRGAGRRAGRYGEPAIFNGHQGSPFASTAFTTVRHREQTAIRADGIG